MSARIKGFYVTLKRDMHEDDAAAVQHAIEQFGAVAGVNAIEADTIDDAHARQRIRFEIQDEVIALMERLRNGPSKP